MKIGLVLEGGAMRGVFTAGILDVFLENGLEFDSCHAVSAGSCLACSFLSRQIGRGYAVMTDYLDNKEYCSVSSLLRTGDLFGADFLYHKIPEQLYPIDNATFLQGKTTFYSVATNCESGRAEYLKVEDLIRDVDAVRASASLPLVSRIVDWKGKPYLDGGIADPIPVEQAFRDGCDRVVVILTRHRAFRKSKEKTALLMGLKYRKYPHLVSTLKERHRIYNDTGVRIRRKSVGSCSHGALGDPSNRKGSRSFAGRLRAGASPCFVPYRGIERFYFGGTRGKLKIKKRSNGYENDLPLVRRRERSDQTVGH